MANVILQFEYPINQSCQVGDLLYYVETLNASFGGFIVGNNNSEMIELGQIIQVCNGSIDINTLVCTEDLTPTITSILCDTNNGIYIPNTGDNFFYFFGKDRSTNEASITGYYGEVTFMNNSTKKAELFMTGCEITESSK
tara:strand:+ start:12306 stop:12725 length:420 start_codon:yes stop_codon:yes gene_type:complete